MILRHPHTHTDNITVWPVNCKLSITEDLFDPTPAHGLVSIGKQEAQLSQRDRTMLHVIEYFAKSLKVN